MSIVIHRDNHDWGNNHDSFTTSSDSAMENLATVEDTTGVHDRRICHITQNPCPMVELRIPNDSTASLETAGVLGETYVEIDVTHASGPPVASNAVLRTVATPQITQELIEKAEEILSNKCDCDAGKTNTAADATSHKHTSKSSSPTH